MSSLLQLDESLSRYAGKKKKPARAKPQPTVRATAVYSRPLYGTGEHVLTGDVDIVDKYKLDVNGVSFAYGDIIAMADLYESYSQMASAPKSELQRLRKLIAKSTRYYQGKVKSGTGTGSDVGTEQWQTATKKRYLRLAEDNYAHFAPTDSQLISGYSSSKMNHKREWEYYHNSAIEAAKQGTTSNDLDEALAINAFGDHFLTDAFAAGHLFNKDDLNSYFKSRVFSGNKLNANGNKLMEEIGRKAFNGRLKKQFSKYETYEPLDRWWNIINWNPNIHKLDRFQILLKGIMHEEPDLIGKSLVAKVIHDKLNGYPGGVPVVDGNNNHWNLSGDDSLNQQNLAIIQEAVRQSIQNVFDASEGKVTSAAQAYDKVWNRVPRPTAKSRTIIKDLVKRYTNPLESELSDRAAKLLQDNLDDMLEQLVARKKLKKA